MRRGLAMFEFFSEQFTWNVFFGEVLWNILLSLAFWSYLITGVLRAVVWLFKIPLRGTRGEVAFWVIVPVFVLVIALFATFLSQATTSKASQPILKGQIDVVFIGRRSDVNLTVAITLIASIRNLGSPTIVENWSLTISLPSGQHFTASLHEIPEKLQLHREGAPPAFVYRSDALYEKTISTPLSTGGMQRGVLVFMIDKVRQETVMNPGTKLTLGYQDVTGKNYSLVQPLSGIERNVPYFPGIKSLL
jgi:hypothetical protein